MCLTDGVFVTDINECTRSPHICQENSHCVNSAGEFNCICDNGYYKDNMICCESLSDAMTW